MARKSVSPAEGYIEDVQKGRITVGKYVGLTVERHVRDLTDGPKRGLYFDPAAGQRVIDFYKFLKHSKGEWAGQTIVLEPWQQFNHYGLFGWKLEADGFRRFRQAYISVARKNGKSTDTSGIGNYGLVGDGEPGAEIYSAATTKPQARIIHGEAVRMVNASPFLKQRIRQHRDNLFLPDGSKFVPLSADHEGMDGFNVHFGLIDELHAHKTREIYDKLDTATGSRRESLIYMITTAGAGRIGVCWDMDQYACRVLEGTIQDDTFYAYVARIDEGDDWKDERVWIKANPNLGVSAKLGDIRRKCLKAQESARAQNAFRRLHCNEWTDSHTAWISNDRWKLGKAAYTPESLHGMPCYGGLDLASTNDIAAFCLVFPRIEDEKVHYRTLFWYWIPQISGEIRARKVKAAAYPTWVQQGYIEATEGDATNFGLIQRRILELSEKYNIRELAVDPHQAQQMMQSLEEEGLTVVSFNQGKSSMSEPTKTTERLILGGHLEHQGDPVTTWMLGNVTLETGSDDKVKPSRKKSSEKIDGMVALIMAIGRAMLLNNFEEEKSVYEERGIVLL